MLVSRQPVLRRFWHAVMPLSELADGPRPFTLLGENIVLFLDANGQPAALRDRCCHRTARLSKGWCVDAEGNPCKQGNIQCGYHGWTYAPTGQVIDIPQLDAGRTMPQYKTTAYQAVARYGYVWVALEDPIIEIPPLPEFSDPGYRTIFQFYERWQTSPIRALENSFDNAHHRFVHRATFGGAAKHKPQRYEIVENETGFFAESVIQAANPESFHRISGVKDAVTTRHMRNVYHMPFARRLDLEYPSGIRHIIMSCYTPIDDGSMMLCQWLFRNDAEEDCPADMLRAFDAAIVREDREILESTDPDAVVDTRRRGIEHSMESDRPGILIRRKFMQLMAKYGETEVHG